MNALHEALAIARNKTKFGTWIGQARTVALAALACALAAEVTARLDDWAFNDVPLLSSPDRQWDLTILDENGSRGRPHGRFQKFTLNSHGFRSPEITVEPRDTRVMVLGASETFGLHETSGFEYPAQLGTLLKRGGTKPIEVVNTAVAGMTIPTLEQYWRNWVRRFKPRAVLIYPSPQFYLDIAVPKAARPLKPGNGNDTQQASPISSRVLQRVVDNLKRRATLQSLRSWLLVGSNPEDADAPPFSPAELDQRLEKFKQDLTQLARAIAAAGARPILVTHAFATASPPTPAQIPMLNYYRIFFPRAAVETIPAFDTRANKTASALFRGNGWPVIDAAAKLNGKQNLFADPVHFNDRGAKTLARIIAEELPSLVPPISEAR